MEAEEGGAEVGYEAAITPEGLKDTQSRWVSLNERVSSAAVMDYMCFFGVNVLRVM